MSTQCQFYLSKKGCRNGDSCRFLHTSDTSSQSNVAVTHNSQSADKRPIPSKRAPVARPIPKSLQLVDQDQAASTLRSFEISQVQSRFKSTFKILDTSNNTEIGDNETFELKIPPSDPDFPYEIETLHINLTVPLDYPQSPCSLLVLNLDIPKGFSTNLERGFAQAVTQKKSILAHLNWLDVNMEQLLQKPPAPTIRFIGNANQGQQSPGSRASTPPSSQHRVTPVNKPVNTTPDFSVSSANPQSNSKDQSKPNSNILQLNSPIMKSYSPGQIEEASLKRQKQLAQIQARFRASFSTISPTEFQISLESTDMAGMTIKWQGPLWVNLLIPKLYPLDPCDIRLKEDGRNPEIEIWRARNIEQGFRNIVASMPHLSLFQLLNQLNRDLKELVNMPAPTIIAQPKASLEQTSCAEQHVQSRHAKSQASQNNQKPSLDRNPKIIYVDAPIPTKHNFEQTGDNGQITSNDDDSNDDDDNDSVTDSDDDDPNPGYQSGTDAESENSDYEDVEGESKPSTGADIGDAAPKRGIEIRMPDIKLENISLMYCRLLNLLVRCNRCKSLSEIPDLVPEDGKPRMTGTDTRKWRTCENCQSLLGAHFRTEYIHMQSRTVGYIDLAGCTAFDILPSIFVPTCSECDQVLGTSNEGSSTTETESTSQPESESMKSAQTSVVVKANHSVPSGFRQRVGRGMSSTANCRKCHVRMTFSMEGEIKFVRLSPGDLMKANPAALEQLPLKSKARRKNKNGLEFELKVGEPLPRKGACDHYKKSRRWFRFPCCSKIYPCHICHDEKESDSHESEYAKRMVCGHCSREQNVSDKPCICGESPVKSKGGSGAFWEGGEGVRDKTKMSVKDPRKYRGFNKTVAKKQVGAENVRKRAHKSVQLVEEAIARTLVLLRSIVLKSCF
ncbi:hypothetical protein BGZ76_009383 [Entomortierella beljakovae]|nr:hypothetical protein BGZ76_009383 [Entomortierella beljakovae]